MLHKLKRLEKHIFKEEKNESKSPLAEVKCHSRRTSSGSVKYYVENKRDF
jgi:hypothetical protein